MKYKSLILATSILAGIGCAHAAKAQNKTQQSTSVRLAPSQAAVPTGSSAATQNIQGGDQLNQVGGTITNSTIDSLSSKIFIASKKLKLVTLQEKIAEAKAKEKKYKDGGTSSSPSNSMGNNYSGMNHYPQMMGFNPQGQNQNTQKSQSTPAPQVQSIFGFNNHIQAVLEMNNGQTLTVVPGETIKDGLKIVSIGQYGVLAEINKKKVMLTFNGSSMPSNTSASGNSTNGPGSTPPIIYGMSAPQIQHQMNSARHGMATEGPNSHMASPPPGAPPPPDMVHPPTPPNQNH